MYHLMIDCKTTAWRLVSLNQQVFCVCVFVCVCAGGRQEQAQQLLNNLSKKPFFFLEAVCFKCSWKPHWWSPHPNHTHTHAHTHTGTHTHTDPRNSLLKSLQQHHAQRFSLPFPRPPKCFSVLHGPPHKRTHKHRQTVLTSTQRICKSAFIGPLAAHTHAQRKTQIYTHTHTQTYIPWAWQLAGTWVAARTGRAAARRWQSSGCGSSRLWVPSCPAWGLWTPDPETHTHIQTHKILHYHPVSSFIKAKEKNKIKSQIQLLYLS